MYVSVDKQEVITLFSVRNKYYKLQVTKNLNKTISLRNSCEFPCGSHHCRY